MLPLPGENAVFHAVLAAQWDFIPCSLHSNSTEEFPWLTNTPRDAVTPSETWWVSSGSPSCSCSSIPTYSTGLQSPPEITAQELGQQEGGRRFGSPLWNTNFNFPDSLEQEQLDTSTATDTRSHRKRGKLPRAGMFSTALADPLQFVHESIPSPLWARELSWSLWWLCTRHCSKGSSYTTGI